MATFSEMISRVRSSFKLVDADNVITNRMVADELRAAAIKLIKQQTDKRRLFSSDNVFTEIPCLAMTPVPLSECCDYRSPCMIAKSVLKLPKIAENIYGPLIQGVYSIDGSKRFEYADPDRYANLLRLYPKKEGTLQFFWLRNGYLYITDSLLETVTPLIFPEEEFTVGDYSCYGPPDCPDNPMDMEFKAPGYLHTDIVEIVRKVIERDYKPSKDDKTVDQNDESK